MSLKSERLKKLESEMQDLEQWEKLGLVPKKDLPKHKDEIRALKERINEEKVRLRYLKESGESEEYAPPKRAAHARSAYPEAHTMPEMDIVEENMTEAGLDIETESFTTETATTEEEAVNAEDEDVVVEEEEEEEEDPFSDRNRWKRGVIEDPEANEW